MTTVNISNLNSIYSNSNKQTNINILSALKDPLHHARVNSTVEGVYDGNNTHYIPGKTKISKKDQSFLSSILSHAQFKVSGAKIIARYDKKLCNAFFEGDKFHIKQELEELEHQLKYIFNPVIRNYNIEELNVMRRYMGKETFKIARENQLSYKEYLCCDYDKNKIDRSKLDEKLTSLKKQGERLADNINYTIDKLDEIYSDCCQEISKIKENVDAQLKSYKVQKKIEELRILIKTREKILSEKNTLMKLSQEIIDKFNTNLICKLNNIIHHISSGSSSWKILNRNSGVVFGALKESGLLQLDNGKVIYQSMYQMGDKLKKWHFTGLGRWECDKSHTIYLLINDVSTIEGEYKAFGFHDTDSCSACHPYLTNIEFTPSGKEYMKFIDFPVEEDHPIKFDNVFVLQKDYQESKLREENARKELDKIKQDKIEETKNQIYLDIKELHTQSILHAKIIEAMTSNQNKVIEAFKFM